MIYIDRVETEHSIVEMVPHLSLENDYEKQLFAEQFINAIRTNRSSVFCVQARNEDDELIGFIIAQSSDLPFVSIHQAWSKPGNPWLVIDHLYKRTILWALSLGFEEIRAETKRSLEPLFRRFGFEEHSVVVKYKINPNLMDQVILSMREKPNG